MHTMSMEIKCKFTWDGTIRCVEMFQLALAYRDEREKRRETEAELLVSYEFSQRLS